MAGGGKETPRQKMIGMMYLVLTALLAMNVSKQILHGYITVNESMEKSRENLAENNKRVTESFEHTINGNPAAAGYFEKAKIAQKMLKDMEVYIDQVKLYVIGTSEATTKADTVQLKYAQRIDDYDNPSRILGVAEPGAVIGGSLTAQELKGKLDKLSSGLNSILDEMQTNPKTKLLEEDYKGLKKKFSDLKPVASGAKEDGVLMTWEVENFYHLPMAAVVVNLNKMVTDLKNTEAEMLNIFSGASGKLAIKFDKLSAKVIAPSSYIQAGQPYTADIFLAASSSAMTADQMQVLLNGDSLTGNGGTAIDIKDGMGKYSVNTGGQGEQKVNGIIKFKKPDGTYENYPWHATYMVAAPAVAVQLVKMNVMYIGVDNPVQVSAAGVSPTELQVNVSGCGATKTGSGGKLVLRATSPGTCMVSVSAKGKSQGPAIPIRVKKIPDPVAKVGGKTGNVDVKKVELGQIGGVGAELAGFDFDAKFIVVSFELTAVVKGNLKSVVCQGNSVNSEARSILSSAGVGSKIFFENVKAKGPDGTIRNIPGVTLKVK
ncbi:MAG: gliding motility protein GldM [Bacteroidota bacterium]|nr:gliding motility protein GldM [Bacteroidota bacterium]MDP3145278.1 gliding motility protein GldM [Bacteroidota bacterium]MDP3556893.1 gliding motility protein GldM [Bacteroidota bacterium]